MSLLTGCQASTVTTVPLNVTPPATVALPAATINCGASTTTLTAGTTTTSTSYSYTWSGPLNAGMSCPGGVGCYSTTTNMPGLYFVSILNTVNGCRSTNSVNVVAGSLNVQLTPNPSTGFAPLNVNFENTSPFTSNGGTVTTIWSYGNGITASTTSLSNTYSVSGFPDGNTTYQSAGTYTVLLMMTQVSGTASCAGTATALVTVELPSELSIPNVFTPNGDGVNDNFTLQTTNLGEISCTIFDRWGVKMHDVKSDKGNISWDGKNFSGKEVPDGTYFYILKTTGKDGKEKWTDKDGKEIKMEGVIHLYR
jgi:gliding motility-associated-like protein